MTQRSRNPPFTPSDDPGGYGDYDESRRYRYPDERERTGHDGLAEYTDDESKRPRFNPGPHAPKPDHEPPPDEAPRQHQSFRGYGPRGHARSDERLREEIAEKLTWHEDIDARDIQLDVDGGEVTLTGTVPERRMKRLAQVIADSPADVKEVHNELRVKSESI